MSRVRALTPPLLVVLLGCALLRITLGSDLYLQYVKEGLHVPLILSGVLLILLGAGNTLRRLLPQREPVLTFTRAADGSAQWHSAGPAHHDHHGHDHGHDHGSVPRVAGLLAVPALALLFFAPPALGAYSAEREGTTAAAEQASYAGLTADQPTTAMSLTEFIGRSNDPNRSLEGRKVRLLGFAAPGAKPGEWYLNRLLVSCCAADARRLRVQVHGAGPAPATDSWVEVTGVWKPVTGANATAPPVLDVLEVKAVAKPRNPYRDVPPEGGTS
ncbi:TIGR03943 family protein [Streptomyces sp. CB01881]|uniref:TIGR03943 family putative permease subunit n=1 Tax=Streptomyces sp. CB01881 TaxID=2078691 RepID=UPI000CDC4D56|nr:TIGR03943 family protein [Streptomyces sp. CB01881]AUY52600.1 TIGR03943 family protein [Streptomyces sp. CB01881]TYC70319.1 TIGR03943 family protein [Streptomyces sp. CB01881]